MTCLFSDDVFLDVRAGQPVTHMTSQLLTTTIQSIPDGQNQVSL